MIDWGEMFYLNKEKRVFEIFSNITLLLEQLLYVFVGFFKKSVFFFFVSCFSLITNYLH